MTPRRLLWFRRDLRLSDNPALLAAMKGGAAVLPVFVIDPGFWKPAGTARRRYLVQCLTALDHELRSAGSGLMVWQGSAASVIPAIASAAGVEGVWCAADFGPAGRQRDRVVGDSLRSQGKRLVAVSSPYAVTPGTLVTKTGSPYRVFTPFFRAWGAEPIPPPVGAPASINSPALDRVELEEALLDAAGGERRAVPVSLEQLRTAPLGDRDAVVVPAGERAAMDALVEFVGAGGASAYHERRDLPGTAGTSRLSAALKFGSIHPRQVLAHLSTDRGAEVFRSELAWRDFYADVLFSRPETAHQPVAAHMAEMVYDTGSLAEDRFDAWVAGRTGYPIVDAGMRQLRQEAWMHNRVRMIVASFLVKDLHLDWRRGARYFMDQLVDGDLASNQHGWQWVAGTGTDASPYFRIFNPVTQSKKFDPSGTYLRRWLPELEHLPAPDIHEPWVRHPALYDSTGADTTLFDLRSDRPTTGYPPPIVDHAVERLESLARYEVVKGAR